MARTQDYHKSAIIYNERLAEAAEELAPTLVDAEVQKWCVSVGKQHRFHAKRHRSALNKLLLKEEAPPVEQIADGLDVHPLDSSSASDAEPTLPEPTEVEEILESQEVVDQMLPDGCSPFHDPSRPECEFAPKENVNG
jgi:hypothetical protein